MQNQFDKIVDLNQQYSLAEYLAERDIRVLIVLNTKLLHHVVQYCLRAYKRFALHLNPYKEQVLSEGNDFLLVEPYRKNLLSSEKYGVVVNKKSEFLNYIITTVPKILEELSEELEELLKDKLKNTPNTALNLTHQDTPIFIRIDSIRNLTLNLDVLMANLKFVAAVMNNQELYAMFIQNQNFLQNNFLKDDLIAVLVYHQEAFFRLFVADNKVCNFVTFLNILIRFSSQADRTKIAEILLRKQNDFRAIYKHSNDPNGVLHQLPTLLNPNDSLAEVVRDYLDKYLDLVGPDKTCSATAFNNVLRKFPHKFRANIAKVLLHHPHILQDFCININNPDGVLRKFAAILLPITNHTIANVLINNLEQYIAAFYQGTMCSPVEFHLILRIFRESNRAAMAKVLLHDPGVLQAVRVMIGHPDSVLHHFADLVNNNPGIAQVLIANLDKYLALFGPDKICSTKQFSQVLRQFDASNPRLNMTKIVSLLTNSLILSAFCSSINDKSGILQQLTALLHKTSMPMLDFILDNMTNYIALVGPDGVCTPSKFNNIVGDSEAMLKVVLHNADQLIKLILRDRVCTIEDCAALLKQFSDPANQAKMAAILLASQDPAAIFNQFKYLASQGQQIADIVMDHVDNYINFVGESGICTVSEFDEIVSGDYEKAYLLLSDSEGLALQEAVAHFRQRQVRHSSLLLLTS